MSVDVADLFKYGWILLLTIIPKYVTSNNTRFKALEKSLADVSTKVAVISTKLDSHAVSNAKVEANLSSILNALTEIKIEQGKMEAREGGVK